MTSPALAIDNPETGERRYRDPADGAMFPSVTTVIGLAHRVELERWKLKEVAGAAVAGAGGLAEEVAAKGAAATARRLAGTPERIAGEAAAIGDEVHNFLEALAKGERPPDLSDAARPFEAAAREFLARFRPRFVAIEATVFNRKVGYAGTADFVAGIGPLTVMGDWKTGRHIHAEVGMQMAALAHGEEIVTPEGRRRAVPAVDGGIVVHIRPEGFVPYQVDIGESPWRAFRALTAAWHELADMASWVGRPVGGPERLAERFGLGQRGAA